MSDTENSLYSSGLFVCCDCLFVVGLLLFVYSGLVVCFVVFVSDVLAAS